MIDVHLRWCCGAACAAAIGVGVAAGVPTVPRQAAVSAPAGPAIALQALIDATASGGTLTLEGRRHAGPVRITRPMTIRGQDGTVIEGGGVGSVVTVEADDVTIAGVTIRGSGDRHDEIDAAIRLRGRHAIVKDNVIEDCLYGIEIKQGGGNVVRRNRISSKAVDEPERGDAIRIWYSRDNRIEANVIRAVRDGVGLQANDNAIVGNTVEDSRYGALLLYAHGNAISDNRMRRNTVGVMAIASHDLTVRDNFVGEGRHAFGNGLVLKDSSRAQVTGNALVGQAQGIWLDASPSEPEETNLFRANRLAYNGTAVAFHSDLVGNLFEANDFLGNHGEVVVRSGGTARRNDWRDNRWDGWVGFDRDCDGVGDTPFEVWAWADRLWMDVPAAQLFRAAPSLALLDFTERLAPLSEPRLLMRDDRPRSEVCAAPG